MIQSSPKVSVIVATYNRRDYVQEAINSVLEQTYPNFEIIVVDDGSSDDTDKILSKYGTRIHYKYQKNQGESVARNQGVASATGEYIAFLDDDDLWLPEKLARQVEILDENPDIGLVATQGFLIDQHSNLIPDRYAFPKHSTGLVELPEIILNSPIGPSSSIVRRSVLAKIGAFDPLLKYGEDWDFVIRTGVHFSIFYLNEPLVYMRAQSPDRQSNFLLNSMKAHRRYEDHMHILEKARSILPPELTSFLDRAVARVYAEIGIHEIAIGDRDYGKTQLTKALETDPTTWLHGTDIEMQALAYVDTLLNSCAPDVSLTFLNNLFNQCLPDTSESLIRSAKRCYAQYFAALAFKRASEQQWDQIRLPVLRAIWHDPKLMSNNGLISVFIASFLKSHLSRKKLEQSHFSVPESDK